MRFGKPSSLFNVIYNTALMLDANFYQTMLLCGDYKPQRIHRGGTQTLTGPSRDVYYLLLYLNFITAHAPEWC